jgi:predicted dehydrogenase
MKKLRCGFVGGGTIMRIHAEALSKRQDVDMVAVAEIVQPALATSADMFDIPGRYRDFEEMFQQEVLDFAVICVPNAFHATSTLAALNADCHVLCEKPPAMNVAEAKTMAATAEKKNLRLAYGLHMRFTAQVETARCYLDAGRLGDVYHATAHWLRRRGIPGLGSWFTTKAVSGGGVMIDIGVHELDRAHYLMGQPKPIAATGVTHARFGIEPEKYNYLSMWGTPVPDGPFDVDDLTAALIRFENGASLMLQVSWAANTPEDRSLRVMGTKGGLILEADQLRIITEDNGFNADITPLFNNQDVRIAQLDHFINCIRNPEEKLRIDAQEGIVLQHMLDAVYQSAETGREILINID